MGIEIAGDHAGQLHVDERGVAGVVLKGFGKFFRGDPLGELVSIQTQLAADPDNAELRAAEKALFEANTETFLGPETEGDEAVELAYDEINEYQRPKGWPEKAWQYGFAKSQWENGFIRNLYYDSGYYDDEEERGSDIAIKPLLAILGLPSARFVREIALGDLWASYDMGEGPEMEYAVRASTDGHRELLSPPESLQIGLR